MKTRSISKDPLKNYSDEQLIRHFIKTADSKFFNSLYCRYSGKVYRVCVSKVKNLEGAEDLTQDIFLKVILKLDSLKTHSKFESWLMTIAHNQCISYFKTARKLNTISISDNNLFLESDLDSEYNPDLEMPLFEDNPEEAIMFALDQLAADEKNLLLLRYQHGLCVKEIADKYKSGESAIKMRLMRCRNRLRTTYQKVIQA